MIKINENKVVIPLTVVELESFFDSTSLKVIKYFLRKSLVSQPEKLPLQEDIPIQIPKEHIEQWVCQSIGAIPVGAGSYAVDVLSKDKEWGADIKMLSCQVNKNNGQLRNSNSGETSLSQNFGDSESIGGNTLDELFKKNEYGVIWDKWKYIFKKKYLKVNQDFGVTKIYYFFILRANLDFHLCGLKVDLNNLEKTEVNYEKSTNKSVWIKNFIDNNFGNVKVYRSKKRLELRLRPKYWVDNNFVKTFSTDFKHLEVDIRNLVEEKELNSHIDSKMTPILKNLKIDIV
tara:strand:+ start:343 stop:1206 length:864 start_codon:yes stop_codon:yes gene_type:complete